MDKFLDILKHRGHGGLSEVLVFNELEYIAQIFANNGHEIEEYT